MKRKSFGFDIYLQGKHIDTVFYSSDFFKGFKILKEVKDSIKESLVNHDGYHPNIIIK